MIRDSMTCQLQQKKMQQKINKGNRCRCMDLHFASSLWSWLLLLVVCCLLHAQARQRRQRSKNRTSLPIHCLSCLLAVAIYWCRDLALQEEKNGNMEQIEFWPATVRITPESAVVAVFQTKFAHLFMLEFARELCCSVLGIPWYPLCILCQLSYKCQSLSAELLGRRRQRFHPFEKKDSKSSAVGKFLSRLWSF